MNKHLEQLRHSTAHLLAAAVLELYPNTKLTIGPAIENGFYYDVELEKPITEENFPEIEKKMAEILQTWKEFSHREVSEKEAKEFYKNNEYKTELIEEIINKGEKITFYKAGNFEDLCRGGHSQNPKKDIGAFKLLSVAGAYWRGDEKNKMLTRIYGTAFPTKKELDEYLLQLEEAKKRDHKKLGKELGLFVFSDLVGPGLPLWTPKGTILRNLLDNYVWQLRQERGYEKVTIPHITKKELYETSGHWAKFSEELFKIKTREGHVFAMKPMNCPHHTQIFASTQRSYKDMPQRYTETTMCYRDEQTGELSGLSRTRAFTQDDAHVFARRSQVKEEFNKIWDIVQTFYSTFGFDLSVRLSFHDPDNFKAYLGTPELWQQAETEIREMADERKADYVEAKGEAAFYGPKIDFMAKDSIGRKWQVATIQLDINMPERFDLFCINEEGEKERIVMIHAAIMGSIERFLSILIEHYAGAFPLWLAPEQVILLPIADRHNEFAQKIHQELLNAGIRSKLDTRPERLQAKIRDATLQKAPFMGIIGDKEIAADAVSIRVRSGEDLGQLKISDFLQKLKQDIDKKR
jgi:threonyl-tRNA synthetase